MPKITALAVSTTLTDDDYLVMVDAPSGTPTTKSITAANAKAYLGPTILVGTATYDPANLTNGTSDATQTVTVTGAAVGDPVLGVGHTSITQAGWTWRADVTSSNTVSVVLTNNTGGTVNLASGTLKVVVWRAP